MAYRRQQLPGAITPPTTPSLSLSGQVLAGSLTWGLGGRGWGGRVPWLLVSEVHEEGALCSNESQESLVTSPVPTTQAAPEPQQG